MTLSPLPPFPQLYPRVLGFDVKQFTNCRHALMLWPLLPLSFAAHLAERGALTRAMTVNVALQVVYCFKFFVWEAGYMASMDIAHDRAGYYIAWGCLAFVPSMYVSHSWWLVNATDRALAAGGPPPELSPAAAAALLAFGLLSVWLNYDADRQRQAVRANPAGLVWGARPRIVRAPYTDETGAARTSVLLASGWWGIASHFHYVPELTASLAWSLPAGGASALPYAYVAFLAVLLVDRAFRDDARCAAKYGKAWAEYRALVPWKVLPGVC
jgi:7-dehydrocholesterol reductase